MQINMGKIGSERRRNYQRNSYNSSGGRFKIAKESIKTRCR